MPQLAYKYHCFVPLSIDFINFSGCKMMDKFPKQEVLLVLYLLLLPFNYAISAGSRISGHLVKCALSSIV